MNFKEMRRNSEAVANKLGYSINSHLPLLEGVKLEKTAGDLAARMMIMNCVVAAAHGFQKTSALEWIETQNINEHLSQQESVFLHSSNTDNRKFMAQAEGLWALAWVSNRVEKLDFGKPCSNALANLLPDLLRSDESILNWRERTTVRDESEIIQACDLSYILHWSIQDALMRGEKPPGVIPAYSVIERRRALEWLLQPEDWDAVDLST